MHVTTITASIRLSQDTGNGWKSVELGAEATVDPGEDWHEAQLALYTELTTELRQVWRGAREALPPSAPDKQPAPRQAQTPPEPPAKDHWCEEHQTEYKRREGNGRVWYSHRVGFNGPWCNESDRS